MSDDKQARMDRFFEDATERNKEIMENLKKLRGNYRAKVTSELANLSLIVSTIPPELAEPMTHVCGALHSAIRNREGWDTKEMLADIEMLRAARMQTII